MNFATVDSSAPTGPLGALPVTLEQSIPSRAGLVAKLLLIGSAGVVLLAPFALLAVIAVTDPAGFMAIARQPMVALQLGLALLMSIAFVTFPLRHVVVQFSARRSISITGSAVSVAELGRARRQWQEPLENYCGIARCVRSSLAGARHELVLVHPDPAKSVTLHTADRIAQSSVDALLRLTGLAEVDVMTLGRSLTHTA